MPAKRKRPASTVNKPKEGWRMIDSDSEDEQTCRTRVGVLRSSYSKRVADGVVRRSAQLSGDLYIDLRVYQVDDIKSVDLKKRYEKAALHLNYQTEHDAPEVDILTKFLKRCKTQFREDGWFFADKNQKN